MGISDEKCISLTTFRKSGEGVSSPVWVAAVSDGRIGFWTSMGSGKTKRIKNDPRVTVQACDMRGQVKSGSTSFGGTAELVQSGPLFDEVRRKVKAKYGWQSTAARLMGSMALKRRGLSYADTVVLIRLDD